jgi:glutamate--cysteine ligase catalytic subunit
MAVFIVLLSRTILSLELNMQIPISQINENMDRSILNDAVLDQKFYFKTNIVPSNCCVSEYTQVPVAACADRISEMTIAEIINGKPDVFEGLIPLVKLYLGKVV